MQHVVIEVPERASYCPEPKTFENFPTKKHIAIPITRGRDKRLTWPWIDLDLALSWRIGARLFDAGEICELRLHTVTCLASLYVGKQHRTNNEPQNSIKWRELRPGYTEKAITGPSLCKYNLFLYLCLYFYGLTTILNFLLKVFKSFVISAKQYRNLRYRGGSRIFLRGGALVSCSTSKPINHIVFFFFWQNTSCIRKPQVILGRGAHPLHPPPRSAPAVTYAPAWPACV